MKKYIIYNHFIYKYKNNEIIKVTFFDFPYLNETPIVISKEN